MKKECLAIEWALQSFQGYLYGQMFLVRPPAIVLAALNENSESTTDMMAIQPYRYTTLKGSHVEPFRDTPNDHLEGEECGEPYSGNVIGYSDVLICMVYAVKKLT